MIFSRARPLKIVDQQTQRQPGNGVQRPTPLHLRGIRPWPTACVAISPSGTTGGGPSVGRVVVVEIKLQPISIPTLNSILS
jgi:hypothetical protein